MTDEYIMTCRNVGKRFGQFHALYGINMNIPRGRIVGLLGPNGSGKTTFMKIANGLLMPSAGEILIGGHAPGTETKKIVSYLPDTQYLPGWMTVSGVISFFSDFFTDFDRTVAARMTDELGILGSRKLKTLSKGTREKVQLILAMSRRAELYLLDEPIGGVDPAARDYILNTIVSNYNKDAAIIISTHLIADVEDILDDVIFLQNGSITECRPKDDIREKEGKTVDEYFREVFKC